MKLNQPWKIFLIQHSHTDIGYTERQEKITRYHCDYIKQAIAILDGLHSGKHPEYTGFVWQCENYWQIESFYKMADKETIAHFEQYLKSGEIGFSANYLNMTELIGYDPLCEKLADAQQYAKNLGVKATCGMSADINGFAWGYSEALYQNGVENFFSCLHPHHGMFPLYRKQTPFYWVTPKGNKVLFWNGEHYHIGNEMHFSPLAGSTYMLLDDIAQQINSGLTKHKSAADTEATENKFLETRIERYLCNLEQEGYPYGFVPLMVSGTFTDNAPPSGEIARRVNQLNQRFAGELEVQLVTLEQFFDHVRANCDNIPQYSGDWNDWWADGVGSTPAPVKVFRDAQRKLDLCGKLDPDRRFGNPQLHQTAVDHLTLYAEHTWGYSSSVAEPWESMVGDLELKKSAYAANANTAAAGNLDEILAKNGEISCRANRQLQYRVTNPHSIHCTTSVFLYVEIWEYLEGMAFDLDTPFEVVDAAHEEVIPHQLTRIPRAYQIEIVVALQSGESRNLYLRHTGAANDYTIKNHPYIGADAIEDILVTKGYECSARKIETDYLTVAFDQQGGISSILDKQTDNELVRQGCHPPFCGIYEVTPAQGDVREVRRRMGRNRKSAYTQREIAKLQGLELVENGPVYAAVRMDYKLEGTGFYQVLLKVYKTIPRMDAMVRLHKNSVWEPENLYVSLPFTTGEVEECYMDKTGCLIRPGVDQLSGSGMEFYLLQNGLLYTGESRNLSVSTKDAPLVTFGSLESHPIRLCSGEDWDVNAAPAYSWIMNNFWETNFKVDLGGFYEFAYTVSLADKEPVELAFKRMESYNEGILGYYIQKTGDDA